MRYLRSLFIAGVLMLSLVGGQALPAKGLSDVHNPRLGVAPTNDPGASGLLPSFVIPPVPEGWTMPMVLRSRSSAEYTIIGAVRDDEARVPVPDAQVAIYDAATGEVLAEALRTDAQGRFEATLSVSRTAVDDLPDPSVTHWVSMLSPNPVPASYGAPLVIRYTAPPAVTAAPALEVFDVQGRRVDPQQSLPAGVYFYRLRFFDGVVTSTASFIRLGPGMLRVKLLRLRGDGRAGSSVATKVQQDDLDVIVTVEKEGYVALEEPATLAAGTTSEVAFTLASETPTPEADEATFDVTYAEDAVVIEGAAKDALVESDTVRHRYVFDARQLQQAGVSVGIDNVILIEGVALRRVISASRQDETLVVETQAATLDELIVEGTVSWEHTVDYTDYQTARMYMGKQSCSPGVQPGLITFTCSSDPYTFTLEFRPGSGSSEAKVEVTKSLGDNASLRMTGVGTVNDITTGGAVSYSGGDLDDMDLRQDNVQAEMHLEIAAAGSGSGDQKFVLPTPAFKIPFTVGPIPMHLSIGAEAVFELDVPLEASASATASVDLTYDSDHGFTYEDSDVDVDASVNGYDIFDGSFDSASTFAYVDAQYGVAFPRVGLSILTKEIAWIRVGFTTGTRLQYNPICKTGYGRILVDGGYGLSFLGVQLFGNEVNLVDEQRVAGGDCDGGSSGSATW